MDKRLAVLRLGRSLYDNSPLALPGINHPYLLQADVERAINYNAQTRSMGKSEDVSFDSSYIYSVKWKDFIANPSNYIEKAYHLQNSIEQYDIYKEVD